MKKESAEKSINPDSTLKFNLLIVFFCGLLILAHFFSSFFPKSRLWGINHLAYFPLWVRITFTLLGLSVLVPGLNSRVYKLFDQILSFLQKIFFQRKVIGYALFSLLFMLVFWLLRTRTHFLGDGAQTISLLEKGKLYLKWTEPLEIITHLYAYKFFNLFLKINAETLYSLISILGGGIFVFLLFLLSELFGKDKEKGLVVFIVLATMGSVQLFFGYVEHYTMLYLFLFSYLYSSVRFLERKNSFLPMVVFFFLSIFSHFSAFYLFPSLVFLLWMGFEFENKKKKKYFRWSISILSLILLSSFLFFYLKNKWMLGQVFVPLHPGYYYAPDYTLFSFSHFLDLFSLQLLISPVGLLLVLAFLLGWSKKNKENFSTEDKLIPFLIIVSTSQLGYNFLLNPGLGMARDWDLFSATALGYTLLGIYVFLKLVKDKKTFKYVSTVLIFTSFFSTLPWIVINHNPQLSIQRFRNLLDLDVKKSRNGRFILGQYFSAKGMTEETERVSRAFHEKLPEVSLTDLALTYYREGKVEESIQLLQKAIQTEPGFAEAHTFLGLAYYTLGKIPEAEAEYKKAIELRPDFADSYVNLGHLKAYAKNYKDAIEAYEKAVRLKTEEFEVYNNLGSLYLKENKLSKAKRFIQKAINLEPNSYNLFLYLGIILFQSGNLDEAEKALLKSAQLKEDYPLAYYYLSQIYSKKGEKLKAEKEYELYLKYKAEGQILPKIPSDSSGFNLR